MNLGWYSVAVFCPFLEMVAAILAVYLTLAP